MDPTAVATKGAGELLDKGILGLAVLALAVVVVILWRHSTNLAKEIAALHEKRAEEAKALAGKTTEALVASSTQSAAQATAIDRMNQLLQQILDFDRAMPGQIEGLAKISERIFDKLEDFQARRGRE